MRLEVEKEALRKDAEAKTASVAPKPRQSIEREIAELKEQTSELEMRWKNEKQVLSILNQSKKSSTGLRMEAEGAEASVDLSRAAEIRYGEIPSLERELEQKQKRSKNSRARALAQRRDHRKRYCNNCC
jgi:ATP-dependent Clp protease ATP-binding subunit ClpB